MMKTKLEVLGAGHMRTGTNSLKKAIEILYGRPCYHMYEVFEKHHYQMNLWSDILDKGYIEQEMCDIIFNGYCGAVDCPAAVFYKDLMKIYPDVKVILTIRDTNSWVKSVKNTTFQTFGKYPILDRIQYMLNGVSKYTDVFNKLMLYSFHVSTEDLRKSDDLLRRCFEERNEEIINYVPRDRLLIFNVKDGWKPLCDFLNLPIPDQPFPYVNNMDDFRDNFTKFRNIAIMKVGSFLTALVVSGAILAKLYFR